MGVAEGEKVQLSTGTLGVKSMHHQPPPKCSALKGGCGKGSKGLTAAALVCPTTALPICIHPEPQHDK